MPRYTWAQCTTQQQHHQVNIDGTGEGNKENCSSVEHLERELGLNAQYSSTGPSGTNGDNEVSQQTKNGGKETLHNSSVIIVNMPSVSHSKMDNLEQQQQLMSNKDGAIEKMSQEVVEKAAEELIQKAYQGAETSKKDRVQKRQLWSDVVE